MRKLGGVLGNFKILHKLRIPFRKLLPDKAEGTFVICKNASVDRSAQRIIGYREVIFVGNGVLAQQIFIKIIDGEDSSSFVTTYHGSNFIAHEFFGQFIVRL